MGALNGTCLFLDQIQAAWVRFPSTLASKLSPTTWTATDAPNGTCVCEERGGGTRDRRCTLGSAWMRWTRWAVHRVRSRTLGTVWVPIGARLERSAERNAISWLPQRTRSARSTRPVAGETCAIRQFRRLPPCRRRGGCLESRCPESTSPRRSSKCGRGRRSNEMRGERGQNEGGAGTREGGAGTRTAQPRLRAWMLVLAVLAARVHKSPLDRVASFSVV